MRVFCAHWSFLKCYYLLLTGSKSVTVWDNAAEEPTTWQDCTVFWQWWGWALLVHLHGVHARGKINESHYCFVICSTLNELTYQLIALGCSMMAELWQNRPLCCIMWFWPTYVVSRIPNVFHVGTIIILSVMVSFFITAHCICLYITIGYFVIIHNTSETYFT